MRGEGNAGDGEEKRKEKALCKHAKTKWRRAGQKSEQSFFPSFFVISKPYRQHITKTNRPKKKKKKKKGKKKKKKKEKQEATASELFVPSKSSSSGPEKRFI